MFVSDEDLVSIFKDTDLSRYDGGAVKRKADGYPLGLQVESRIYTWKNTDMKDFIILTYLIQNISNDTLLDCHLGGIYDVDITLLTNTKGASNDRCRYFDEDTTLNLAVGWTETTEGEGGKGFGYIGLSLLESPAVDSLGFIRNDKYIFKFF